MLFYFFHVVPEDGPKAYPDVELLTFARGKADRVAAERLGIEPGDPVVRFRNRLRLAGVPVMVDDITLGAARFAGLTERQFRTRPSTLYNLYQDSFGISVVRTRERLRAVAAEPDIAELLGIARRHAVAADPPRRLRLSRRAGRIPRVARGDRASRVLRGDRALRGTDAP